MACELLACCRLFKDSMESLPKATEYIQMKLCFGDYEACNRYIIYKNIGKENLPADLNPFDIEDVQKVMQCLRNKKS
jgi:hypothetical protein